MSNTFFSRLTAPAAALLPGCVAFFLAAVGAAAGAFLTTTAAAGGAAFLLPEPMRADLPPEVGSCGRESSSGGGRGRGEVVARRRGTAGRLCLKQAVPRQHYQPARQPCPAPSARTCFTAFLAAAGLGVTFLADLGSAGKHV